MKKYMLFLFLVFYKPPHSLGQTDTLPPPKEYIAYYSKLMDSLPYFIRTGRAVLAKAQCDLPEHYCYFITHLKYSLVKGAPQYTGYKKTAFAELCAYDQIARRYYDRQEYVQAKGWALKGLDIAIKNNFIYEEIHQLRVALNNTFFLLGDYASAMKISADGLATSEKTGDKERMIHYNNVLGYIMMKQHNFELAEKYFFSELQLARQIKNRFEEAKGLLNLADLFITGRKELTNAISFIKNALNIYVEDSANTGFEVYGLAERRAYCNHKLAEVYKIMQNYHEALQHSLFSIRISRKPNGDFYGNLYDVSSYYINTGDIYNKLNRPDSALLYLRAGLYWADSIKHNEDRRDAYEQFSISFATKRQFDSAWFFQQKYRLLNDSILNVAARQNIAFIQSQFDTERKDRQIRDQQTKLKRQSLIRNIIIGSSIVLLLIGFLSYNSYRLKQKKKLQQQLNKQQSELMNTVIAVQDKERKRIAEDLHDSLGSILSAAKLRLSAVADNGNGRGNTYNDTLNLLDEAVNEMRSISHNLLPASLLRLGLVAGLQNLLDKISSRSGLQISFIAHGFKRRIEANIEVSIYRIVLEAVNNTVKHAQAKNVTVQLMQYDSYINVLVEDDGIGFDKGVALKEQGIGLNNIFSRVDHMKGKIDIDTKPAAGTVINIDIPYTQTT